jgi:uncharacterized membrane protein
MIFYRYLFYGLVAIALLQSAFYYPQMPAVVASHFDGNGVANNWSSRNGFFGIYLAMIALLVGVFLWVPRYTAKGDKLRMNIPNRDYWLAPERRQQTQEFFQRQMMILGIAHLLLAIYSIQLAIIANLQQAGSLHGSIIWALGLYFVFLTVWLLHIFLKFRHS